MTEDRAERAKQVAEKMMRLANTATPEERIDLGIVPPSIPISMVTSDRRKGTDKPPKEGDQKK